MGLSHFWRGLTHPDLPYFAHGFWTLEGTQGDSAAIVIMMFTTD